MKNDLINGNKGPNFFIVGAPKSATTAMYEYLRQHPDVFMPPAKELHFFGEDLEFRLLGRNFASVPRSSPDRARYLSFFSGVQNQTRRGEASVWYLYSKQAAREIQQFCSNAKIIIMLRNPVDLLYSLHSQFLWEGNENIGDFEQALSAEPERKQRKRIPETAHFIQGLFYRDVINFSEQVNRYFDEFGHENVLVLLYEDFVSDFHAAFRTILTFLGLPETFIPEFKQVNANKRARSKIITHILAKPPTMLRSLGKLFLTRTVRSRMIASLRHANTRYVSRPPLDAELRASLFQEFLPEIERLSRVLQRDLSVWTPGK